MDSPEKSVIQDMKTHQSWGGNEIANYPAGHTFTGTAWA